MRYDKNRKDETRRQIVERSSERFRRDGIAAVGLRSLMTEAGLTHGGFYAHFASRSAVVEEAVSAALEDTLGSLNRAVAEAAPVSDGFAAFVDSYLHLRHVERKDRGCAGAALAPEIAREGDGVKRRFTIGIDAIVKLLEKQLAPGGDPDQRIARAYAIFSGMMGALQLARAIDSTDRELAILRGARGAALMIGRSPWE